MPSFIFINDRIVSPHEATVSVADRGLRFGDGVFETIRVHNRIPYQWELHLTRLEQGLNALKIEYNNQRLLNNTLSIIEKNDVNEGTLRMMITRGEGSIGYLPTQDCIPTVIIEAWSKNFSNISSGNLWLSSYTKVAGSALPKHIKLMQGINSTLAKMEAREQFCDEALLLDDRGIICEAASGNIFWVKNNILYTPSLECPMVSGTMRSAILRLSPLVVKEGCFSIDTLKEADELFLTNASWPILPIRKLNPAGVEYQQHETARLLATLIMEDMQSYADAWQPPVA